VTAGSEGTPERVGRMLGHLVARTRVAARQAADPGTHERLAAAGREAARLAQPVVEEMASRAGKEWRERGPDVAEGAAHRAVDSALWGIGLRSRWLGAALRPFAEQVREAAGTLARELAAGARQPAGGISSSEAAGAPQTPEGPHAEPEAKPPRRAASDEGGKV
jgi:hypothetical protein